MMRFNFLPACAGLALLMSSPALAVGEQSPFFGTWELDLTRMPETYGPPPKHVTYVFEEIGRDQWRTTVEITAPDDSVRQMAVAYKRDGRMVKGQGDNTEADSAAFNSPAPNVLVMSLAKNRNPSGVRVYAISADGKEMTESAANIDAEGAPFVRNFHFKKLGN
jgi:hypothetical protein